MSNFCQHDLLSVNFKVKMNHGKVSHFTVMQCTCATPRIARSVNSSQDKNGDKVSWLCAVRKYLCLYRSVSFCKQVYKNT